MSYGHGATSQVTVEGIRGRLAREPLHILKAATATSRRGRSLSVTSASRGTVTAFVAAAARGARLCLAAETHQEDKQTH
jgi:hypothetical protein